MLCKLPSFVKIIRNYREGYGLTLEEMAELCEMSTRHYSDLEKGKKSPSGVTLVRIFKKLELDMNRLELPEEHKK